MVSIEDARLFPLTGFLYILQGFVDFSPCFSKMYLGMKERSLETQCLEGGKA